MILSVIYKQYSIFTFSVSFPVITLPIDFVLYSPINSNDVQSLRFYVEISNRTSAENFILLTIDK